MYPSWPLRPLYNESPKEFDELKRDSPIKNEEELSSNEQEFVEEIFDQIILDIFNSSVANW